MSKVLGFKKKDAVNFECKIRGKLMQADWRIPKSKLVPVVELAWLEKEVKRSYKYMKRNNYHTDAYAAIDILISAAREQAAKEK